MWNLGTLKYRFSFCLSVCLFMCSQSGIARPVRLLTLPIEASDEQTSPQSSVLKIEERIFLGEMLSSEFSQINPSFVQTIQATEVTEIMSTYAHLLETCGSQCPKVLAQLIQADVIISGRMFRFNKEWRLIVKITDQIGDEILNDTLKGQLNSIETQIKTQAPVWYKKLAPKLLKLSTEPLRIIAIEQAPPKQVKRWTTLGISWIPIKGAKFEMGSTHGHPNERPVHLVNVAQFQMMKTEVTASQYWACVKDQVCTYVEDQEGCVSLGPNSREAVNCVTWQQAYTFAQWIGARLPTEAEWELAAKGTHQRKYPWGHAPASCDHLSHLDQKGREGCGEAQVQAPCQYPQGISPEGICDLGGNVWEWVQDDWHRSYHNAPMKGAWCESHTLRIDCMPKSDSLKTYRGGSWYHPANRATTTARAGSSHQTVSVGIGFRCVL